MKGRLGLGIDIYLMVLSVGISFGCNRRVCEGCRLLMA